MNGIEYRSVADNVTYAVNYLLKRREWLAQKIDSLNPLSTNITNTTQRPYEGFVWGVDGKVKTHKKGLCIQDGKLYFNH